MLVTVAPPHGEDGPGDAEGIPSGPRERERTGRKVLRAALQVQSGPEDAEGILPGPESVGGEWSPRSRVGGAWSVLLAVL